MNADDGVERTTLAKERNDLAEERTMLSWWRTGLAALAVSLAVGRLLPELSAEQTSWPYMVLGLGFAAFATGLFTFGVIRGGAARASRSFGFIWTAGFGTLLALGTVALIVAG